MQAQSTNGETSLLQIDECAKRSPDAVAIEFEDTRLTYRQLVHQSSAVASHLLEFGIARESLVAVCLNRSIEFVVVILGVMRAGAGYVPLDPSMPMQRLEYMIDDSKASLIVTGQEFAGRWGNRRVIQAANLMSSADSGLLQNVPAPDDLAYVIYTSGSTGTPKGVEILHRGLSLCVDAIRAQLDLSPADTTLAITSPSFDVSVMEMFVTLSASARLVLFPQSRLFSHKSLVSAIERYCPTLIFGTPPLWRLLIEGGWKGSHQLRAITGGEALDEDLADKVLERTASFWNHYGPTEASVVATTWRVRRGETPPIGFALPHIRAFVFDSNGRHAEPGQPGELYIGGESLARGYRSHPELTAGCFIDFESKPGFWERVYRTGDIVRQRADGAFEFTGRIDNQVKIRGYRIEPEEVEVSLSLHPEVAEAAVVVHLAAPDEKVLVAYYRSTHGQSVSLERLRAFVSERLPTYMVPTHFLYRQTLPLTLSGKVDRLALSRLPLPETDNASQGSNSGDPVVTELMAIWRRLLKTSAVDQQSNFFELGGHSLLAARLFEEIERHLHKELPLATLFEAPTVAQLATAISSHERAAWSPLVEIRRAVGVPFFCVHPIGGNVLIFRNLSEHMTGRRFFGLQARGLSKDEPPHTSIGAMALDYVACIKQVQPSGPYFLGGYSAGGLVAFEMARMLEEGGEKVERIILFDSYLHPHSLPQPSDTAKSQPNPLARPFSAVNRRVVQLRRAPAGKRLAIFLRDAARFWSTIKLRAYARTQSWRWNPIRLDAVSAFLFAIRNYRPKPMNARVTLFLADENAPASARSLPSVWGALVTDSLEVRHLATDHDHLLDAPFAAKLAREIEAQIEECLTSK